MKIVEVTWQRALKVWWSFMWRSLLLALLVGFVTGFVMTTLTHLTGVDLTLLNMLFSMILGGAVGIWVMKKILYKRFGDFSVVLIANEENTSEK